MFQSTRGWLRRNRTPLAIGAGIVTAGYLAAQYALNKVNETRQRMTEDRIARDNLRRRFAQNQEDCTYTTLALLPTVTDNIFKAVPVEEVLDELRVRNAVKLAKSSSANSEIAPSEVPSTVDDDGKSMGSSSFVHASQFQAEASEGSRADVGSAKTKVQLWNDVKINSITRALTLVYTLSLLTIFTRIQLNLLGRRNYLSSVISLAAPTADSSRIHLENRDDDNQDHDYGNDFETNRKYLTFSWWLLHRGWDGIMQKVETAVKSCFGTLKPNESITFERVSELIIDVRKKVEGATDEERRTQKWLTYLLPPPGEEELVLRESGVSLEQDPSTSPPIYNTHDISPILRRFLDETADLVDSPSFSHVLTLLLDSAFSLLVDERVASEAYRISPEPQSDPSGLSLPLNEPRLQEVFDADSRTDKAQPRVKLANVLAVFTRQAREIGTGGSLAATPDNDSAMIPGLPQSPANDYLAALESVPDLKAFAAVVYSSNFDYETVDAEEMADASPPVKIDPVATESQATEAQEEAVGELEDAWRQALAKEDGRMT